MRNIAFSIMLGAFALLQIAVVAAELSPSRAETVATANVDSEARPVLASTEAVRKGSAL